MPFGAAPPEDYAFEEAATGAKVRLSELFGDKSTLVVYSYMFAPDAKAPIVTKFLTSGCASEPTIGEHGPGFKMSLVQMNGGASWMGNQ